MKKHFFLSKAQNSQVWENEDSSFVQQQLKILENGSAEVILNYLHALKEPLCYQAQIKLVHMQNKAYLKAFANRNYLDTIPERQLLETKDTDLILCYIARQALDDENEVLLFQLGNLNLIKNYLEMQCSNIGLQAELMLLEPQHKDLFRLFICLSDFLYEETERKLLKPCYRELFEIYVSSYMLSYDVQRDLVRTENKELIRFYLAKQPDGLWNVQAYKMAKVLGCLD